MVTDDSEGVLHMYYFMETKRGKEQSNMPHTAVLFIIHNSPNNMAEIVFIIILCKRGKKKRGESGPGFDGVREE